MQNDDSSKIVTVTLIAIMFVMLIAMAKANVCAGAEGLATSASHGYMVTVYNDSGNYYKRWTGVDKVSTVGGGAIQFFDDDGNAVILSPGCNAVVEWIGGTE